ncbi:MAG: hypothetical protein AAGD38_10900 [Acidobacteriota bacterium]
MSTDSRRIRLSTVLAVSLAAAFFAMTFALYGGMKAQRTTIRELRAELTARNAAVLDPVADTSMIHLEPDATRSYAPPSWVRRVVIVLRVPDTVTSSELVLDIDGADSWRLEPVRAQADEIHVIVPVGRLRFETTFALLDGEHIIASYVLAPDPPALVSSD